MCVGVCVLFWEGEGGVTEGSHTHTAHTACERGYVVAAASQSVCFLCLNSSCQILEGDLHLTNPLCVDCVSHHPVPPPRPLPVVLLLLCVRVGWCVCRMVLARCCPFASGCMHRAGAPPRSSAQQQQPSDKQSHCCLITRSQSNRQQQRLQQQGLLGWQPQQQQQQQLTGVGCWLLVLTG